MLVALLAKYAWADTNYLREIDFYSSSKSGELQLPKGRFLRTVIEEAT